MSRSVMIHPDSRATVYLAPDELDPTNCESHWLRDEFIYDLQDGIMQKYPSFVDCSKWLGRETMAILENKVAYVTMSEYNGLVAICLVPKTAYGATWANRVAASFKEHVHRLYPLYFLIRQGCASNGEEFFTPANRPDGMITSKEGTLW